LASIFDRIWLADSQILAASCCLFKIYSFFFIKELLKEVLKFVCITPATAAERSEVRARRAILLALVKVQLAGLMTERFA